MGGYVDNATIGYLQTNSLGKMAAARDDSVDRARARNARTGFDLAFKAGPSHRLETALGFFRGAGGYLDTPFRTVVAVLEEIPPFCNRLIRRFGHVLRRLYRC
ncbi:hypothetical protein BOS5A_231191 [Bosea sp. EC-HK365B]|nr:hypothetical protein BOSE7B_50234 [Bosea sp. 7B]CAD5300221.1 hypothetical protein BOSE21B_91263 [Bosea sp. 21B]VVT61923.1 hypothetical protein BOS5A_231191 [Bosea sp. EC-HK365B]VXC91358.1 hypothetical protein BOSE29B_81211 [Bosea sp. 29B]VXC98740.1 hypothetical protein BOSE127_90235 [Bosea sp. 127]